MRRENRILVVDDDSAIRALLMTILRRRGHSVDTAKNGAEAVQRCARCSYSLVLLDLMMPVMNGYEFLETLEGLTPSERPMVIVLTAGGLPAHLNPEIVSGTVRKPFDIEMLVETVTACMNTVGERSQADDCPTPESENPSSSRRTNDAN